MTALIFCGLAKRAPRDAGDTSTASIMRCRDSQTVATGSCCADKPHGGDPWCASRTAALLRRRRKAPRERRGSPRGAELWNTLRTNPSPPCWKKSPMMVERQNLKCKGFGKNDCISLASGRAELHDAGVTWPCVPGGPGPRRPRAMRQQRFLEQLLMRRM
jgi:hypothetical protein